MKENFEKSLKNILKYEGGYTNHSIDKGGATNLGITLMTLRDFFKKYNYGDLDKDGDVDFKDIKLLDTPKEAAPIYKKYFWDRMNLDAYPNKIDFLIFDFGVNSGIGNAFKILQRALNRLGNKLVIDGDIGTNTMKAINNSNINSLVESLLNERIAFYKKIVMKNKNQIVFLKGWLNRVENLKTDLKEY